MQSSFASCFSVISLLLALPATGLTEPLPQNGTPGVVTRIASAGSNGLAQTQINIYGSARSANNTGLPHALLRLRNARTGRIQTQTISDAKGEFAFPNVDPGSYVVELLDETGQVLAAGELLDVDLGQTVATIVRLPMGPRGLGWFGDAAGVIASAAASAGVLAVAATGSPASPGK
jgi:hypothetical protein